MVKYSVLSTSDAISSAHNTAFKVRRTMSPYCVEIKRVHLFLNKVMTYSILTEGWGTHKTHKGKLFSQNKFWGKNNNIYNTNVQFPRITNYGGKGGYKCRLIQPNKFNQIVSG